MSILAKYLVFVKTQSDFHRNMLKKPEVAKNPWRLKLHTETAEKFEAIALDIEAADKLLDSPQAPKAPRTAAGPIQLTLNIEDIADLPKELIEELSISEVDRTDVAI